MQVAGAAAPPPRHQLRPLVAVLTTLGGRPRAQRGHTPLRTIGRGTQEVGAPKRVLGTEPRTGDSDHGRCSGQDGLAREKKKKKPPGAQKIAIPCVTKNWLGSKSLRLPLEISSQGT